MPGLLGRLLFCVPGLTTLASALQVYTPACRCGRQRRRNARLLASLERRRVRHIKALCAGLRGARDVCSSLQRGYDRHLRRLAMLATQDDHSALASAIAGHRRERRLFCLQERIAVRRTAALMVSVARSGSSTFRLDSCGRKGVACAASRFLSGSRDLLTGMRPCALERHRRLKASLQAWQSIAMRRWPLR